MERIVIEKVEVTVRLIDGHHIADVTVEAVVEGEVSAGSAGAVDRKLWGAGEVAGTENIGPVVCIVGGVDVVIGAVDIDADIGGAGDPGADFVGD